MKALSPELRRKIAVVLAVKRKYGTVEPKKQNIDTSVKGSSPAPETKTIKRNYVMKDELTDLKKEDFMKTISEALPKIRRYRKILNF